MDRLGRYEVRRAFLVAWVFLVVVVALGFLVQARTIASLHDTQDDLAALVAVLVEQQRQNVVAVCDVTYGLHPDEIARAGRLFERNGIDCPKDRGA